MRRDDLPTSSPTPTAPPGKSETVADRATSFQPVEGGEVHSGQVLLVEAYVAIWLFLLAFIALSWRKQARLHARLTDLERVVDRAAAQLDAGATTKKPANASAASDTSAEGVA